MEKRLIEEFKEMYNRGFRFISIDRNERHYSYLEEDIKRERGIKWNLREDGSLDAYEMLNGDSLSKERIEKLEFVIKRHKEALESLSLSILSEKDNE